MRERARQVCSEETSDMGAGAAYPPRVGDLPWAGDSAARPTCNSFHSVPTDSPGGSAQPTVLPFLHLSPSSRVRRWHQRWGRARLS